VAVRLEWDSKPTEVERLSLPFQTVETINESRATRERDEGSLLRGTRTSDDWRNLLIWGDNKLVMSSLLSRFAGRLDVVYIDPPFDTGADFTVNVHVGDHAFEKTPTILEEHAYRDTWGRGRSSYLEMMFDRVVLIHELLSEQGSMFLHCDWRVGHYLKVLCDEIFGSDRLVNEIAWCYTGPGSPGMKQFNRKHDTILWYSKTEDWLFDADAVRVEHDPKTLENFKRGLTGSGFIADTYELAEKGKVPEDWWLMAIAARYPIDGVFRTGYATEKPWPLIERILKASTREDSIVGDFFAGSGTTVAVAEKLGRKWIACDLGRFAIHTTRKRLLNIPDCRPFEIQNLGAYERQRWRQDTGNGALRGYLDTILAFYRAEPVEGFQHLHGRKAGRMVHVGATDAPVTVDEAEEVMDEMADNGVEACELLGWEWEMGFHDTIGERARRRGLDVRALQIPREVMERRVQEADAVRFFQLAHVDLDVRRQGKEAMVVLKDFAIESEDLIPSQVRERITTWSDLIDYWSVDFDHRDGVFRNQWQAYRTRAEPVLATESSWHEYPEAGRYSIVVKIIDIFGNDTTKLAEVKIR
jgi:adenine-specific DNA-methyltransferase